MNELERMKQILDATPHPGIFCTSWIWSFNQPIQIKHYFGIREGKIYHLPAHRGIDFKVIITNQFDIKDMEPDMVPFNEYLEDNSEEVFQALKKYLDDTYGKEVN